MISDDSTRDQIVTKGEDIELFCNASGNPHPKLSWRRQGAAVLPNGGAISHGSHLRILVGFLLLPNIALYSNVVFLSIRTFKENTEEHTFAQRTMPSAVVPRGSFRSRLSVRMAYNEPFMNYGTSINDIINIM